MQHFKTGDSVQITFQGKTVAGRVEFASGNGYSLMLTFDAMLGGYVMNMPVLWDAAGEGRFKDLMTGSEVVITLAEV